MTRHDFVDLGRSVAFATGTLLAIGLAAAASAATVEDTYVTYHAAIEAADQCTDYHLIQIGTEDAEAEWIGKAQSNMGAYIDTQIGNQISAGDRLHLVERAKGETDAHIATNGCDDPDIVRLLTIFHNELEPLLPPR